MPIASVNPATGETLKTFQPDSAKQIGAKLRRAAETFATYRRTSFSERRKWLETAAQILERGKTTFAKVMTLEMGKTFASAVQEAEKCALGCRFYAENAERFLADEIVQTNAGKSYVRHEPLGAILAVMPWNFPFWQVFRFAAPALMAGNVGLLKHASNVPQCALAIEEIFRRAGFPEGAFQTLLVGSGAVNAIIEDPRVKAVTLTGSEPAGMSVASAAGKTIKKSVLELGGSDPFIVMPSANISEAAATAVKARVINNGQSCIAAKRFIVAQEIADEFLRLFTQAMGALRVGDPMDERTEVGPLVNREAVETLGDQIKRSVARGAKVVLGGKRLERAGFYYAPTILTDIPKDSPAYSEEFFGPVALVFRVKNIDEAIALANDTAFGLGSSAWTTRNDEQKRFIEELEAGSVFINGMVISDPRVPFGGVKRSGYGRELSSHGIREFVNVKTVWIK
jgi:succinate-semialdehyde dehydrogenase/glutarate-semialdehyde dehydrogenase